MEEGGLVGAARGVGGWGVVETGLEEAEREVEDWM